MQFRSVQNTSIRFSISAGSNSPLGGHVIGDTDRAVAEASASVHLFCWTLVNKFTTRSLGNDFDEAEFIEKQTNDITLNSYMKFAFMSSSLQSHGNIRTCSPQPVSSN